MTRISLDSVADEQLLYLTTVGGRTGLPREIEIWFVVWCERLYLFAETREAAAWVKNIRRNPNVKVRIGEWRTDATARVLHPHTDRKLWDQVAAIANRKYGWGDGLPVEITSLPSRAPRPADGTSKKLKEQAIPGRLKRQKAQQADATVKDVGAIAKVGTEEISVAMGIGVLVI